MAEIVTDIAIHRRISCYSVGLKMLCLVGVNLEDLVGNYPLCTMAPIYLLSVIKELCTDAKPIQRALLKDNPFKTERARRDLMYM